MDLDFSFVDSSKKAFQPKSTRLPLKQLLAVASGSFEPGLGVQKLFEKRNSQKGMCAVHLSSLLDQDTALK